MIWVLTITGSDGMKFVSTFRTKGEMMGFKLPARFELPLPRVWEYGVWEHGMEASYPAKVITTHYQVDPDKHPRAKTAAEFIDDMRCGRV